MPPSRRSVDGQKKQKRAEGGPRRVTRSELRRQVLAVAADVPLFCIAPLVRRWHCRLGARPTEVTSAMPSDDLLPRAQYRCTRAITIDAPARAVWPWLVQVGCRRAGFYSNDLLDNLGQPSAREICRSSRTSMSGSGFLCLRRRRTQPRSASTASRSIGGCCGASRTAPGPGR
jgi:hypothetical protein